MELKKSNLDQIGHRARVKEKFIKTDTNHFHDYELLEILLFTTHPRKDVKPLAKSLLRQFGSLNAVINADIESIQDIEGINKNAIVPIKVTR